MLFIIDEEKTNYNSIFVSPLYYLFLFSTFCLAVAAPLKSYIMQWIIDTPDKHSAILCLFQSIAIILLSHILEYSNRMSFTKISCKSCEEIRKDIMDKMKKQTSFRLQNQKMQSISSLKI